MAYIQKLTPPPNTVMNFSLRSFVGGLNNRSEQLEVNEASDVLNMVFEDDTVMAKRHGQVYYDATALTNPITFIDEFKPYADTNKLIRSTNTAFYIDGTKIADITGKPCGVNHSGKYFFADGAKLYVYGKFDQTTTTYRKVIGTAVNTYVLMEITSPADGHARLDTTHTQGVLNIDYTNHKVYYEPCENEFLDTYKGANKIPTKSKYIVSRGGRIYVSGCQEDDDNVFISHVQNPYYFPVSLPIQVPPNSDKISGLYVYDDSIVIGRQYDLHVILGNTNRPDMGTTVFQLKKLNSHTGFACNTAISIAHNYLFFFGSDGNAYALSSVKADAKVLSTTILSQQIDIEKAPISVTLTDLANASSVFFKDEWYTTVGSKVLIYSYRHRAWTMFNNLNATCLYVKDNALMWGRSDGRTAKFSTGYLDFDIPFQAFWSSKRFDMDDANSYKQFREFFIVAHTFETFSSDINVTFEIDYDNVSDTVVISNQIAVFGKAKWGARFINRNIVNSLPFTIGRRGRSIKFKVSNGHFPTGTVATVNDFIGYPRNEGVLLYVTAESAYYLYTESQWVKQLPADLNQTMKVYQINGDYELRGKR